MDTMAAFMMGQMNSGKEKKVFDWDKAAEIIRKRKPQSAFAGLEGDFDYTGGLIYSDDNPVVDEYTYLASTWATPILVLNGTEEIPCYRMQHEVPAWDHGTKWPHSAVEILNRESEEN